MDNPADKMELLAPAGSPEALEAAVASGADAVYLGLDEFSARSKAVNFNRNNLAEHIKFCHNRNVNVYVTLNILIYDDEMKKAFETACFIRNCGADALIIQDIGLFSLISKKIPDIRLHASTQLSINTAEGAELLKDMGFERVILAREMNLDEMQNAAGTGIGTEVFVHGARCYSYSGQCLMSSMLGGRSGNRGQCAQTCRLPYTLSDEKENILMKGHLLSLRDTMYLEELDSLRKAGVSALKIEGRMKGPEYVAAVTAIYRKYLDRGLSDGIESKDMDDLYKAFNREGFSKGALSVNPGIREFASIKPSDSGFAVGKVIKGGHTGSYVHFKHDIHKTDGLRIGEDGGFADRDVQRGMKAVIPVQGKPGDLVYRTRDPEFNRRFAHDETMKKLSPVPVVAEVVIEQGMKPSMKVQDPDGNTVETTLGFPVEPALSGGTSPERIKKQILKTGATDFEITKLNFKCDQGIYIRISDINELRRTALEGLYAKRTGIPQEISCEFPRITKGDIQSYNPLYTLLMYSVPEDFHPTNSGIFRIYLDIGSCGDEISRVRNICQDEGIGFFLHIPYSYETVPDEDCDGYLIENTGMLEKLKGKKIILGSGFNISNSYSLGAFDNINGITLSHELNLDRISALENLTGIPLETTVYGNIKVMESPYCFARDICNGSLCLDKDLRLTDRKGENWGVIYNDSAHSVRIFNPHKLMAFDRIDSMASSGVEYFRLNIMDETASEISKLLEYAAAGIVPHINTEHRYTKGNF